MKQKRGEKMEKYTIFGMFYNLSETQKNNKLRNELFNIIVKNGWLEEYNNKYPNEFGL